MKRVFSCTVSNQIELLYVKRSLKNLLKIYETIDAYFLELATMELGTNLLKYAKGGELWFLIIDEKLAIASVDFGVGIDDTDMVKQKGYSSRNQESLGIGLFSLSSHKKYNFEIISFSSKNSSSLRGSVCVLYEKNPSPTNFCSISLPLYDSLYNGDFIVQKDRFMFFGDTSGHGKKAYLTSQEIIKYFDSTAISTIMINNYFEKLHKLIIRKALRSFVGCIVEMESFCWKFYGIGNVSLISKQDDLCTLHLFSHGIIGEKLNNVKVFEFSKTDTSMLLLMSDGLDTQKAFEVAEKFTNVSKESLAIAITHFAGVHDDKTIAIFT